MKLKSVFDKEFIPYGKALKDLETKEILSVLERSTEKPDDHIIYIPSDAKLEALPVFGELRDRVYGGMPIQAGYCNGFNTKLNCLEYHRGAEVCIAGDDVILLVAKLQDMQSDKIDSSRVEAFSVPKGAAVLTYETTLHYAPAKNGGSFRTVILLPKDTNTKAPASSAAKADRLLRARNKWLVAHPDSNEAKDGAVAGITGRNIDITTDIS
jgi:hypothetical protein